AERGVGFGEYGGGGRRRRGDGLTHPDGLGTLAREDECDAAHALQVIERSARGACLSARASERARGPHERTTARARHAAERMAHCMEIVLVLPSPAMTDEPPSRRRAPTPLRAVRPAASRRVIARLFEADLSAPVVNAGIRTSNPRELSERVAMGRALWRELV